MICSNALLTAHFPCVLGIYILVCTLHVVVADSIPMHYMTHD